LFVGPTTELQTLTYGEAVPVQLIITDN